MDKKEQTIIEHLTEFRRRFLAVLACFFVVFLVSLLFSADIFRWLTSNFEQKLLVLGPDDILWIYISLASLVAFSLTLPFLVYQVWEFVRPALRANEARAVFAYIPATFLCFVLGLAFSFAFYGLVRKKIAVEAQTGMLIETLWLLPVAAIYLFGIADSPTSHMAQNPMSLNLLLIAAGIVTTIPLLCFTGAATRLRLSTLGFFQYIGPTLMFLLAVTFYGEVPGADKMVTFAFIWVALAIFVADAIYTQHRTRKGL